MSVTYVEGDLFDWPAIGHGVNCEGRMGAGIATLFKKRYPDMYIQYKLWCDTNLLTAGGCMPWEADDRFIFNIASQDEPGANARAAYLAQGLMTALTQCESLGFDTLAVPRIGAGIGGLEWVDVQNVYTVCADAFPDIELIAVSLPGADD